MDIAILTPDTFGQKMAGPAIRVWEMAKSLCTDHTVSVFSFGGVQREGDGFSLEETQATTIRRQLGTPDIVIAQGNVTEYFPWLADGPYKLVIDWYDPLHMESLTVEQDSVMRERQIVQRHNLSILSGQALMGDYFLCASDRQRDMWMGYLSAAGRVNPWTYENDPSFRKLIDIVPFGVSNDPAPETGNAIRSSIDGIDEGDIVIIWGGGIYNWFDPLTVIRAVDIAKEKVPNLKVFFLGVQHPNPDVPQMQMVGLAHDLARDTGLLNTHVFFNESWVEYDRRGEYLRDADIAVSSHYRGVETDYSYRTRMLDYLWAGLPIVCTEGDFFAEAVTDNDAGIVTPYEDVEAMAEAFIRLATQEEERRRQGENSQALGERMTWKNTLRPLLEYCANPTFAPDRFNVQTIPLVGNLVHKSTVIDDAKRVVDSVREDGLQQTQEKVTKAVARRAHFALSNAQFHLDRLRGRGRD